MEKSVKIELSVKQWEYVLNAIGQRPFVEVADLIAEIRKQASLQLVDDTGE